MESGPKRSERISKLVSKLQKLPIVAKVSVTKLRLFAYVTGINNVNQFISSNDAKQQDVGILYDNVTFDKCLRIEFPECKWNQSFTQYMPDECIFNAKGVIFCRAYNCLIAMQLAKLNPPYYATDEMKIIFHNYKQIPDISCFWTAIATAAGFSSPHSLLECAQKKAYSLENKDILKTILAKDWNDVDSLSREERNLRVRLIASCIHGGLYIISSSFVKYYPNHIDSPCVVTELQIIQEYHIQVEPNAAVIAMYDADENGTHHFDACFECLD